MARQILEPSWSGGDWHPSRRRSVTSEILSALLASGGALSLTDLAENTRYAEQYVRLAVRVLRDHEYLRPADGADDRYAINEEGCCALGVRILPDRLLGMVTDLQGQPLRRRKRTLARHDAATVVREVARLVQDLRTGRDLPERLIGLGVELGGHVDGRVGDVVLSPNLAWSETVPLARRLHEATGLETVVQNDVTALATYQQLFGWLGKETSNFAVIMIGDGIGSGLVVDGDVVHGAHGMAGEIGHTMYVPDGRPCRCGNFGCVEAYASVPAILARSAEDGAAAAPTLEEVAVRVADGDAAARRAVGDAGEAIGRAISTLENLVNPGEVLVAVPAALAPVSASEAAVPANAARLFGKRLREAQRMHTFSNAALKDRLRIEHVADLDWHGARGAAAAVVRRFAEQPLRWRLVVTSPTAGQAEPAPAPLAALREGVPPAAEGPDGGDLVGALTEAHPVSV